MCQPKSARGVALLLLRQLCVMKSTARPQAAPLQAKKGDCQPVTKVGLEKTDSQHPHKISLKLHRYACQSSCMVKAVENKHTVGPPSKVPTIPLQIDMKQAETEQARQTCNSSTRAMHAGRDAYLPNIHVMLSQAVHS